MNTIACDQLQPCPGWRPSRREAIGAGAAVLLGGGLAATLRHVSKNESGWRADVFIGAAAGYEANLAAVMTDGLRELGISHQAVRGKRILLKPNLVETAKGEAHINTHPAVLLAAAEVFRRMDAAEVFVAEGQGHRRDTDSVLEESRLGPALHQARLPFVDMNSDDPVKTANRGRWSKLGPLFLPRSLLAADWVVSLPKLKTHHWVGVTCSMKNLFGVMPGIVYGWPKNVLHYAGISESILDINATVRPALTIVDAVMGMEGDGPIMGTPRQVGCLVMGRNLPAVDATCTRLMTLRPEGVKYLALASGTLGPIRQENIAQRGEPISRFRQSFALLDAPHLRTVGDR